MRLLVIGAGYVGLVSAACFANIGHHVTCLDIDEEKIAKLRRGGTPIYEQGLGELIRDNLREGRLNFSTSYRDCNGREAIFIAVDTPSLASGGCDRSQLRSVRLSLAKALCIDQSGSPLIVMKSTAPVGTCEWMGEVLQRELFLLKKEIVFDVASNPEFLREGVAVRDFLHPDRVVLEIKKRGLKERIKGPIDGEQLLREIYAPLHLLEEQLLCVDLRSNEMIKYASNAMLACRISFMNEMAQISERVGADVEMVRQGMGSDGRIGQDFLHAGAGFGGSCFPKDLRALRHRAREEGVSTAILDAVEQVNVRQQHLLSQKVCEYYRGHIEGRLFALWGLAFKPGTDDLREAPSLTLVTDLLARGAALKLYDPAAMPRAKKLFSTDLSYEQLSRITFAQTALDATQGSDGLILVTEWPEFRAINLNELSMKGRVIFDGRNLFEPKRAQEAQLDYISIGRRDQLLAQQCASSEAKIPSL